ncbi:MAG: N-acetylneuraminate synthase family protein, partial [Rhodospirillaceae bacterium]
PPTEKKLADAFRSSGGQAALKSKVTLLHCTSEYPTPPENVNLRAMDALTDRFGLPVGFSDHSEGIAAATAAVARGAVVIEKHITMDKTLPGPDHKASLTPREFKDLVRAVRFVERALGEPTKDPSASERQTRVVARRSLVALQAIAKGEAFSARNLGAKRAGVGVSPVAYWSYLGKPAAKDYVADEMIEPL